jgi:RNA polymerase sigma-70 factor, ECF subfamily
LNPSSAQQGKAGVSKPNLQTLYTRHRQALFTLALSWTRCRALAEDAVHDGFVRICRNDLSKVADLDAYVFAAVRNAAIDQSRRAQSVARLKDAVAKSVFDVKPRHGSDPQAGALRDEEQRVIAGEVDNLPDELREVVVLRIYGGLSFAQIAWVVGQPLPTIASRYRRALARLRLRLERHV